jgi:hypothetical protein
VRVTVIIPTTAGPALVAGLHSRPHLPRSQVNTEADYRPLPDISERYHDFVEKGGPLRRLLDLGDVQFELRLDRAPETGRSWELPVALAHWCSIHSHEIVRENPDLVVWATGAIKPDLDIRPDTYHLRDKLEASGEMLARYRAAGATITLLLPDGEEAHRVQEPTESLEAIAAPVSSVSDAFSALSRTLGSASPGQVGEASEGAARGKDARRGWTVSRIAGLSGVAVLLAVATVPVLGRYFDTSSDPPPVAQQAVEDSHESAAVAERADAPPPEPPSETEIAAVVDPAEEFAIASDAVPVTPSTALSDTVAIAAADPATTEPASVAARPDVVEQHEAAGTNPTAEENLAPALGMSLVEYRAPAGSSCIDVLYEQVTPAATVVEPSGQRFAESESGGLCALAFLRQQGAPAVEVEIDEIFYRLVMKSDQIRTFRLDSGQSRMFRLVHRQREAVSYSFSVAVEPQKMKESFIHGLSATGG